MKLALLAFAFLGASASSALANQSCADRTHTGPMGTCTQTCAGNVGSVTCTGNSGNMPQCYSVNYDNVPPLSTNRACDRAGPGGGVPTENPMAPAPIKKKGN